MTFELFYPKVDFVFKRIFGNENNKDLERTVGITITDSNYLKNEHSHNI